MAWWGHPFQWALVEAWWWQGAWKFQAEPPASEHLQPKLNEEDTLISVFKGSDSTTNVHTALDMYKEHVVEA